MVSALAAPLVTPVVALPLMWLLPARLDEVDLLMATFFGFVFSLAYGYVGMLLICLPLFALLGKLRRLDAIRLCLGTTLLGAVAFTWVLSPEPPTVPALLRIFFFNAACSLAVCAFFCVLAEIRIRPLART